MQKRILVFAMLCFVYAGRVSASTIDIGFLTFDHDAPINGLNEITINNFTGASLGCGVVDPSLPVCTPLNLINVALTIQYLDSFGIAQTTVATSPNVYPPGAFVPLSFVFSSAVNYISFQFSAQVNQTVLSLTPGGTFTALPTVISAPLIPNSAEIAILSLNSAPAGTMPEPATWMMLAGSCLAAICARPRLRRRP